MVNSAFFRVSLACEPLVFFTGGGNYRDVKSAFQRNADE